MSRGKFVFISGPYQAKTHDAKSYLDIAENINYASKWAKKLAEDKVYFFCPHLNSQHFEIITPDLPTSFWYELDLEFLRHAWAILLIPGWRDSKGAISEKEFAEKNQIPVYEWTYYDQLVEEYHA